MIRPEANLPNGIKRKLQASEEEEGSPKILLETSLDSKPIGMD